MSVFDEIAAILHPMPEPGDVEPEDLYNDACHEADQAREEAAFNLEAAWDAGRLQVPGSCGWSGCGRLGRITGQARAS